MTFDETIEKFEQEANEYNGLVPMETIYELILDLKEDYAPTVEMKPYQFDVFKKYRYGVSKGDIDFGGIWSDQPYRMMHYFKEESYTGTTIWDERFAKAWLHPETIKVIGEKND